MLRTGILGFFLLLFLSSEAQTVYAVYIRDKQGVSFDPYAFFDKKAIERRIRHGLTLADPADFPLNDLYVNEIALLADEVLATSRWLNAVFIKADAERIYKVKALPYVIGAEEIDKNRECRPAAIGKTEEEYLTGEQRALLRYQTERMQGSEFRNRKVNGKGVRIALFDTGFPDVDNLPYFRHLFEENRLVATYDFIRKKDFVYAYHSHGTATLACISGIYSQGNLGLATGAEIMLARVERALFEPEAEEYYWLAAAEWADRHGADIISSSLGYGFKRYRPSDMNGRESIVSRAAAMAAARGILVVNAAGNEYGDSWRFIVAPADADSVLCVGGTNPRTDHHISFSSMGPTADLRMKPNVSAPGHTIGPYHEGLTEMFGTSFSCPLVSGFAACVMQLHPDKKNMEIFRMIEKAGHLYPYFDYLHGFGIPQASFLFGKNVPDSTFSISKEEEHYRVDIDAAFINALPDSITGLRDEPGEFRIKGKVYNLYYNLQAAGGVLREYGVIGVHTKQKLRLRFKNAAVPGDRINVHFEGYTGSLKIER